MSVEAAILNIQQKWLAIEGVAAAPDQPTEATAAFPFAMTYERNGDMALHSAGFADQLVYINTEIHIANQMLPASIRLALTFRDPFIKALMNDPQLGGSISTIQTIAWTFGRMEWAGTETVGYRFSLYVKVPIAS